MGGIGQLPRRTGIAVKLAAFVLIFALLFSFLTWLICPEPSRDATLPAEYSAMEGTPDNLMLGTSVTFRSFVPLYMEELTGESFCDLSLGAESFIGAWYLLKDAIDRGKKPERVFLLMTVRRFTRSDNDNALLYIYENLAGLRNRIGFLTREMDMELWPDALLLPFRVRENLTWEQAGGKITGLFGGNAGPQSGDAEEAGTPAELEKYNAGGYTFTAEAGNPLSVSVGTPFPFEESLVLPENLDFFDKIVSLCKQDGIDLVLISRPRLPQNVFRSTGYGDFHNYVQRLADDNGLSFWDLTYLKGDILTVDAENFIDERHGNASLAFPLTKILAGMYNEYKAGTLDLSDWLFDTWDDYLTLYGDRVGLVAGVSSNGSLTVRLVTGEPGNWTGRIRVLQGDGETWETLYDWTDWSGGEFMHFSLPEGEKRASRLRVELQNADGDLVQYRDISIAK